MRYLVTVLLVLSFAGTLLPTSSMAERVTIKVPDRAEDGNSVPIRVTLDSPLASNETLTILANGEIAAQVTADTAVELTEFGTKLRLACNDCKVSATMAVDGEIVDSWDKTLKVIVEGQIPEAENERDHKVYARSRRNSIQVMINKQMSQNTHITEVNVDTNRGTIAVRTTLYISSFPYFKFKGKNSFDKVTADNVIWLWAPPKNNM